MATVYYKASNRDLTEAEIEELERAEKLPETFDPDCPPLSDGQLALVAKFAQKKREARKKTVFSLRISKSADAQIRSVGKGFSGFASRLIEEALKHPDLVEKCL